VFPLTLCGVPSTPGRFCPRSITSGVELRSGSFHLSHYICLFQPRCGIPFGNFNSTEEPLFIGFELAYVLAR